MTHTNDFEEMMALIRKAPNGPEEGHEGGYYDLMTRASSRGDGIALYTNHDLGSPSIGSVMVCSYGSTVAQLPTDPPPEFLPNGITNPEGGTINWRYVLDMTYRAS